MGVSGSLAIILVVGVLYYWLTVKAIEKYKEAWINGRGFGVRIMVYTLIYGLIVLYAVS